MSHKHVFTQEKIHSEDWHKVPTAKISEPFPVLGKDDLISSAHAIQTNLDSKKSMRSIPLFDHKFVAFTFREKEIPKGQYKFPFTFKLPTNLPGSF